MTKTVKFQDLPETMKAEKIADYASAFDCVDLESTIDTLKEICATLFGIKPSQVDISYTINSNDDFVAFECDWEYTPGAVKELKSEFPDEKELHTILDNWKHVQRKNFYSLFGTAYCGRDIIRFDTYKDTKGHHHRTEEHISDEVESVLNDLANHFLTMMRKEYEYQTSTELISELLEDMEYEIDKSEMEQ